jgi:serpin B
MTNARTWLRGLFHKDKTRRPDPPAPGLLPASGRAKSFAEDHADFAVALYERLRGNPGNVFFSPFSVRAALGMACAGARGETAAQMRAALRFPPADEAAPAAFADLSRRLAAGGGGQYEMVVANSLWAQDGAPLRAEFLDVVARHYGGGTNAVDFVGDADAAREAINRWVAEHTRRKIPEVVPPGGLNADTRLVLANAVYFKGRWTLPFSKDRTKDEPFYLEHGGTVRAPLMYQHAWPRYMREEGFQAVELGYEGGDVSMLVLLPDKRDGLADLEARLSSGMLLRCAARTQSYEVELFLPRFTQRWGPADLGEPLAAVGMPLAFARGRADFSGINGYEPPHAESLYVSAVFHEAFVDVDEKGTEAAAATTVGMMTGAAPLTAKPPPVAVFRADHAFLFAILARRNNAVLFLGRVADPTRAG